jgi:UDP-sulfoquinovose synthase
MKIVILGSDGYLGWPMTMRLANQNHNVIAIDNYFRRTMAKETNSEALIEGPNLHQRQEMFEKKFQKKFEVMIGDCSNYSFISNIIKQFKPDVVIHFAEQPSAPYSMMNYTSAKKTFDNNLNSTFNLIWAILENKPECHIIKLGTMGEYGTPNIDIEEGWINIKHNGREEKFLYPRQASSLYHTTKVLDTDLLWFYVRSYGLKVTDLMQGPVYGLFTEESRIDDMFLPNFHYDDIFGTVVNRFIAQAVAGIPLTVYGKGGQTRGYLNLVDTIKCIELSINNSPKPGELKIMNQFTEQFSVNDIAKKVKKISDKKGYQCVIRNIENPRKELEEHYYNAKHSKFIDLGLKPTLMSDEVLSELFDKISERKDEIKESIALPRIRWKKNN